MNLLQGFIDKWLWIKLGDTLEVVKYVYCLLFKFQILKMGYQLPTVQHVSEAQLNHYTRGYLQVLVKRNLLVRYIFPFSEFMIDIKSDPLL